MGYIPAIDVSQYQGNINWANISEPIVIIKVSGGDNGLYYDSRATQNYYGAKNAGKHLGMYHFAGGTDPIREADFFIRACSPLSQNDVLALDWEIANADPAGWCSQFMHHVHDKTGVWPLLYINVSTLSAHDWSPVLANCGLWVADWAVSPDAAVPTNHPYVMQQYTDTPLDRDAWFPPLHVFDAYGYQVPLPAPAEPAPATPDPTPPVQPDPPVETPPAVPPADPTPPNPDPGTVITPEPKTDPTPPSDPVKPTRPAPNEVIQVLLWFWRLLFAKN